MYNVIFIDESEEDTEEFLDYVDSFNVGDVLTIKSLLPAPTIDELIDKIFDLKADAIVVDFKLNELKEQIKFNVPYTGVDLVEAVLEQRESFPTFVMTSFDDDAIKLSHDVNVIYQKDILHGGELKGEEKASFIDRVIQQITHYRVRISDAETEFNYLIHKAKDEQLTAKEEEQLKALDKFLESSSQKHMTIPDSLKEQSFKNNIQDLINSTDKLLEALDGK